MASWFISFMLLAFFTSIIQAGADNEGKQPSRRRQKREWIIPARKLYENVDYTKEEYIAKIRSDEETNTNIVYSLIGPGANEDPKGVFFVYSSTGLVKVTQILDREKIPVYELKGRALFRDGSFAEKDIDLRIVVLDKNDSPPVFSIQPIGSVYELSDINTIVIKVTATDADEPGTVHSKISYSVVSQNPSHEMFKIEEKSGYIKVRLSTLDRERQETYKLIIRGTDMDGRITPETLTGTGTVTINVLDVNDNIPILEKETYVGSVTENTINVEAVRIKAIDLDQVYTENWEAVFTIISGNEAGYFNITTNPKTNEGILMVTKELDYEQMKEINLKVVVSNKAKYHSSVVISEPKVYPIKIAVVNVPEAPHFQPTVKVVTISEDKTINLREIITTYKATDSDTLQVATNVRYFKWEDRDNWLIVAEDTADIRLNKHPDRESKFLVNGTYYAKIICITNDYPSKTATGTIAIQVEDFNDHCPILTSSVQSQCYGDSVAYVTATDGDSFPNAEPFDFRVVTSSTKEQWSTERFNATTVILRSHNILWPGYYTVGIDVVDQQGKFCADQKLELNVCTCTENKVCRPQGRGGSTAVFGISGVLIMLLGLLLLLLFPLLLLLCGCGAVPGPAAFQAFPFDQKEQLITYHTEGQGEDKDLVHLHQVPVPVRTQGELGSKWDAGWKTSNGYWKEDGAGWEIQHDYAGDQWNQYVSGSELVSNGTKISTIKGQQSKFQSMDVFDGLALSEAFLASYYSQKSAAMADLETGGNSLRHFEQEGTNSLAGSLEDICGSLNEDNSLAFLDNLGPQFKTLAKLSHSSIFEVEVKSTPKPPKTIASSSRVEGVGSASASASASTSAFVSTSASGSASTTQMATVDYGRSDGTSSTVTQSLLLQQPTVYLSSAPLYVVEQQSQPTLLLATGQVLGVQDSNVMLLDQGRTNFTVATQNTIPRQGFHHGQTELLVEGKSGIGVQRILEAGGSVPRSVRIVESEPAQVVQSSSSFTETRSTMARGQSGGMKVSREGSALPSELTLLQHEAPQLTGSRSGAHQTVRKETVSVVEESYQSRAAT